MALQLNWKELAILTDRIAPTIEGLFVDRIIVPERERFPEGYLKGEWVIRLTGRKQECSLLLSIRPRRPYLAYSLGKGPKASAKATRSPFDLSLNKHLKGTRLLKAQALHQERVVVLWFANGGDSHQRLGLVLVFIPAAPEAFLVSSSQLDPDGKPDPEGWPILARSRTIRDESKIQNRYIPPNGHQAPKDPPVQEDLLNSFSQVLEAELELEAFDLRCRNAEKNLKQLIKQGKDRLRQSETTLKEAQNEENWQFWGDLLKSTLFNPVPFTGTTRTVSDFETDKDVIIRCDPKLSLKDQIAKFYQNAKRKQRRIEEASSRIARLQETLTHLERALAQKPAPGDWKALEKLERASGAGALPPTETGKKTTLSWLGKSFVSKDGLTIWVGRSKDENLELTFKHARGNDLWMHVRGRPGAHVLIPLQPGKSAPLDTLLDAANLAIHYSGGQNWGKTEVDYTFKKYVKRIKDSSEASYTHNKTLLVFKDSDRIQRLLSQ